MLKSHMGPAFKYLSRKCRENRDETSHRARNNPMSVCPFTKSSDFESMLTLQNKGGPDGRFPPFP
ncbi:hypothetical protein, partial [Tabrizicola sp.]|uniref:hypothetical protein n=1 Tax=Tabrizicola sp. TaxID=2005166 RepID=UPI0035AF2092